MGIIRAIRKSQMIGNKVWLVVEGDYQLWNANKVEGGRRWVTKLVISEHSTRADAEAEASQRNLARAAAS